MTGTDAPFERGVRPLGGFLLGFAVLAVVSNAGRRAVLGTDPASYVASLWTAPFFLLVAGGCWLALRHEGATLEDVGLSRAAFAPGALAFVLLWGWVVIAGSGYLVVTGATGEFGYHFEFPWYWFVVLLVLQLLTVGLVEEFAFRGYVQSKCIALLGGRSRRRDVALGVVIAAGRSPCFTFRRA